MMLNFKAAAEEYATLLSKRVQGSKDELEKLKQIDLDGKQMVQKRDALQLQHLHEKRALEQKHAQEIAQYDLSTIVSRIALTHTHSTQRCETEDKQQTALFHHIINIICLEDVRAKHKKWLEGNEPTLTFVWKSGLWAKDQTFPKRYWNCPVWAPEMATWEGFSVTLPDRNLGPVFGWDLDDDQEETMRGLLSVGKPMLWEEIPQKNMFRSWPEKTLDSMWNRCCIVLFQRAHYV